MLVHVAYCTLSLSFVIPLNGYQNVLDQWTELQGEVSKAISGIEQAKEDIKLLNADIDQYERLKLYISIESYAHLMFDAPEKSDQWIPNLRVIARDTERDAFHRRHAVRVLGEFAYQYPDHSRDIVELLCPLATEAERSRSVRLEAQLTLKRLRDDGELPDDFPKLDFE